MDLGAITRGVALGTGAASRGILRGDQLALDEQRKEQEMRLKEEENRREDEYLQFRRMLREAQGRHIQGIESRAEEEEGRRATVFGQAQEEYKANAPRRQAERGAAIAQAETATAVAPSATEAAIAKNITTGQQAQSDRRLIKVREETDRLDAELKQAEDKYKKKEIGKDDFNLALARRLNHIALGYQAWKMTGDIAPFKAAVGASEIEEKENGDIRYKSVATGEWKEIPQAQVGQFINMISGKGAGQAAKEPSYKEKTAQQTQNLRRAAAQAQQAGVPIEVDEDGEIAGGGQEMTLEQLNTLKQIMGQSGFEVYTQPVKKSRGGFLGIGSQEVTLYKVTGIFPSQGNPSPPAPLPEGEGSKGAIGPKTTGYYDKNTGKIFNTRIQPQAIGR